MVPSVFSRPIVRCFTQIHPWQIHPCWSSDDNHIFDFGISNRCRIKGWLVVIEHFEAAVVKIPSVEILSLTASGIPDRRLSVSIPFSSNGLGLRKCCFFGHRYKGVNCFFTRLDIVKRRLGQFGCRNFLRDKGRSCNSSMVLWLNDIRHLLHLLG